MSAQPARPVWLTRDDLAQRRVRLEFVLHNASTKKVRNTAQALLVLHQADEAAWDAAPAEPAEAIAHHVGYGAHQGSRDSIALAVLAALGLPLEVKL